jgi:hypothetical protein
VPSLASIFKDEPVAVPVPIADILIYLAIVGTEIE